MVVAWFKIFIQETSNAMVVLQTTLKWGKNTVDNEIGLLNLGYNFGTPYSE